MQRSRFHPYSSDLRASCNVVRATDSRLIGQSPRTALVGSALKGHLTFGVEPLTFRRTRCESRKRLNDDADLASGTRSSIDDEPPAHSIMFTRKMPGSNNHFTPFHTDHLIRARPHFAGSKLRSAENTSPSVIATRAPKFA